MARTVATVLAIGPAGAVIGHVGDVRGYLMRGGDLRCLTRDHVHDHDDNEGAARPRPTLSRSVGHLPTAQPDTLWLDLADGDAIALCSFGLYQGLDHETLLARLHTGLEQTARTARARAHNARTEINGLVCTMQGVSADAIAIASAETPCIVQTKPLISVRALCALARAVRAVCSRPVCNRASSVS